VADLEALQAIAALCFLPHHIQNGIDQFCALGVMALGPVVTSTSLAEHEVVGSEQLTEGSGSHGVHGTGFQVHEDCAGDITSASSFIIVHIDAF
jgi:hypothetical protein